VDARLGGLWEFPGTLRRPGESLPDAAERAAREVVGLEVIAGEPIATVDHGFTHVKVSYHAVRCAAPTGEPRPLACDAVTWVAAEEIARYALPLAQKKIASLATEPSLF
jgi:A/G-specific adenine glycosylase